jgi:hypothetical protein
VFKEVSVTGYCASDSSRVERNKQIWQDMNIQPKITGLLSTWKNDSGKWKNEAVFAFYCCRFGYSSKNFIIFYNRGSSQASFA